MPASSPWTRNDGAVYVSNGEKVKQLYTWRGPFASIDPAHLVADSAVRKTAYDDQGNLVISSWSHGGNNVMMRYPYDIERFAPNRLGHHHGGSVFCIAKMGPKHNLISATIYRDQVATMSHVVDGSVVWVTGGGYLGKLPNTLSSAPFGCRIAVSDPDLGALRFHSAFPGCGTRVVFGGCYGMPDVWGFATGKSKGRTMLLCLTGAVPEEKRGEQAHTPPLKNPLQPKYGGGLVDGYAVLLDLTASRPFPKFVPPPKKAPGPRKPDPRPVAWPAEGQVFLFGTERYAMTTRATFRDEKDAMWPSFFAGRGGQDGTFTYGTKDGKASFVLDCPNTIQDEGRQDQKVCGELLKYDVVKKKDDKGNVREVHEFANKVKLVVTGSSPWEPSKDVVGTPRGAYPIATCRLEGALHIGERQLPRKDIQCRAYFTLALGVDPANPEARPNAAQVTVRLTVTGKDIGLTGPLAEQKIRVKFDTPTVSRSGSTPPKKEKIKTPKAGEAGVDLDL